MSKKTTKYKHPEILPIVDGVLHFPGLSKTWLRYLKDLPVQADQDVFIDTYPKSGTTWVSEVTLQICHGGWLDSTPIHKRVPFMEESTTLFDTKERFDEFFLSHPSPRIFKSHLPYHQVPMGDGTGDKPKYIYTIRNPKDVAVSYYYHYEGFKPLGFVGRSWDEFFEMFITDQVVYGSWFNHVLGWWAHRDDSNILILKFEDMKKNLAVAVKQIAEFLGKELSQDVEERIAEQTTFTAMAADKRKGRFYDDEEYEAKFRVPGAVKFLRKGEVGDWQNYFTEEQNRRFDDLYEKRMAGSGLELSFN